ncbi:sigma-70 family RNA polymerase sigma factor [Duganella sp. sic0402]|uniref:sigma-70 family RNA polymerase sigma factor n=1 Tax=Duganella sp. sic0402 TaxID=2854786 RepID=UPI001C45C294|nr:sigma-70 family RNA polymerase sigma factor [Duganella sp. sic0402]
MVTHYYRELLNFLARAVNNRDTAADLAQESYLRVLALQESGEAVAEPRALLYRTARNLLIDRHRRDAVRGQGAEADAGADDGVLEALAAPAALEPETAAMSAQAVQAMLAVIGELPLRCREAFILHKFDGLPQAKVAQQMGISLTMVERHIKNAMEACRRCQQQYDDAARKPSE